MLRNVPVMVYRYVRNLFVLSVEVSQNDEAFAWLIGWLDQQASTQRSKRLAVTVHRDEDNKVAIQFTPLGFHWFRYHGRIVWLHRSREHQRSEGVFLGLWESVTISTLSRKRGLVEAVIAEAYDLYKSSRTGKVTIWNMNGWGQWEEIVRKFPRAIDSVVLPTGLAERILADLRAFIDQRVWYTSIGVPYRRGYLLYGPPGNGKSSLVFALASELNRDLAVVSLASPSLTDDLLRAALARMPANAILLFEDIDGVFNQRHPVRSDMKVTFSGLLNALDGVATADGRIMFVTTNFIERLDEALIRPGRIDVRLQIGNPNREQISRLYRRFFGEDSYDPGADGLSMASYQERFIKIANGLEAPTEQEVHS